MCEKPCKPKKIKMLRLIKKPKIIIDSGKIWQDIINFDIDMKKKYDAKKEAKFKRKFAQPEVISKYLESKIYPFLIPAFEYATALALSKNAHEKHKQIFNAIDAISEYLWNTNSKYPDRKDYWKSAYSIYKHEPYTKDRPEYPLHWIISKEKATLMIQRFWRGYNIRKIPEVEEMRSFWKQIKLQGWEFKTYIPQPERSCPPRLSRKERLF